VRSHLSKLPHNGQRWAKSQFKHLAGPGQHPGNRDEVVRKSGGVRGAHALHSACFRSVDMASDGQNWTISLLTARRLHASIARVLTVDIDIEIQVERWEAPEMSGGRTGKGVGGWACDHDHANKG
jgi:hypothetical protein